MIAHTKNVASPSINVKRSELRRSFFSSLMEGLRHMFRIFKAAGGGYFWNLKAANGETLCHSEVYTTKQKALIGIAAAKRIAPDAPTEDNTGER